jgi:serine/threonine protein kinase
MSMVGKTLGNFTLEAQIGKGGMGEVYKAKDQKLGRDVAIKVLPEEFAKDTDRVARFQREAKLLASLNHPNIAAIHGLEEADGTHFLVLELIEGDTLADRLKRAAIPVEEALKLALQIAEALEAAHDKGVIHRDLKPANIKVTPDGKVKVLDFGLAKAFAGEQAEVNLSHSPTLSEAATLQGVILGTAAYMSPEQARGKPLDKRTDIWAFGCVLYEMLTGKAAFQGEDVTEILAAVVKSGVDLDLLPENLHPDIRKIITRCLQKEQKRRYSGIGDVQYEIEQVLADPSGIFVQPVTATKPKKKLRFGIPWLAATLALGAIIAGIAVWKLKPSEPHQVMRFDYELPENQSFSRGGRPLVAVSADGMKIAYVANQQLYLRKLNELKAKPIQGTDEDPNNPFFSPNGQWIGYYSTTDSQLKKITVSGGAPVTLCEAGYPFGATWGSDDTILFGQQAGIMSVSANGGPAQLLIEIEGGEQVHGPQLMPGGEWVLFTLQGNSASTDWDEAQIVVQSLKTGERKLLVSGGSDARYLPTGHLVYALGGVLSAIVFDVDNLKVIGGAVPILEGVQRASGFTGAAQFGFSDTGMLAYVVGGADAAVGLSLVWVDRNGEEELLGLEPKIYLGPRISPDGTKVALTVLDGGDSDIWIWDLIREIMSRLTLDETTENNPLWTTDGQKIVFSSNRDNTFSIYWKSADGAGESQNLCSASGSEIGVNGVSWSHDGKFLLLQEVNPGEGNIGMLSMDGDRPRKPLLQEKYNEIQPQISPDGRWIAYASDQSGDFEVYVRPFPEVNKTMWQVSTSGGRDPLWAPDGRELFYRNGNSVMAVEVETKSAFSPGKPKVLFQGEYISGSTSNLNPWDISHDGKRFLMVKEATRVSTTAEASRPTINIVLNWFEELKERVPRY